LRPRPPAPRDRRANAAPLRALCFDDLNMDPLALKPVKEAAERFVKTALVPGDRVAVATVAQSQDPEFTGDVPKLVERIAKVTNHQRTNDESVQQCPTSAYEAYLIANNLDNEVLQAKMAECSACYHAPVSAESDNLHVPGDLGTRAEELEEHARRTGRPGGRHGKVPGERMILLASTGFLTGNLEIDQDRLMAKALHAGVVINTLDAKGLYTVNPTGDASAPGAGAGWVPPNARIVEAKKRGKSGRRAEQPMAVLASGTGGAFYHNNNDLALASGGWAWCGNHVRARLSPIRSGGRRAFHSLKVRLARASGIAASPPGLRSIIGGCPRARLSSSKLDSEAMASDTVTDLPVRFTWERWRGRRASPWSRTWIWTACISKSGRAGGAETGAGGGSAGQPRRLRDGQRSELDLNLTDATFAQLTKAGFTVSMTLEAPPGTYAVRGVVEDALEAS